MTKRATGDSKKMMALINSPTPAWYRECSRPYGKRKAHRTMVTTSMTTMTAIFRCADCEREQVVKVTVPK